MLGIKTLLSSGTYVYKLENRIICTLETLSNQQLDYELEISDEVMVDEAEGRIIYHLIQIESE